VDAGDVEDAVVVWRKVVEDVRAGRT